MGIITDPEEDHSRSRFSVFVSRAWPVLLVIAVVGTFYYSAVQRNEIFKAQAEKASQLQAQDLGLTAERRGDDLLLSWNHDAPAITNATEGALVIQADSTTQQIVLTPGQLRSGSVLYSPTADQFDVRLEVKSPGQPVKEGTIVISRGPVSDPPPVLSSSVSAPPPVPGSTVSAPPVAESANRDEPPAAASPPRQSESKLRLSSKSSVVMLAREASTAAELRDNPGSLTRLIRSGSLFTVAAGTEVAARQMESRLVKVRIMAGSHAGQEGWVDVSHVSRN